MRTSTERIRVLHVDDDSAFADLTATFLEREDDRLEVLTTTSASDGLERLADHDVDCIVSDYDMPGRNGIEFLEAVRESRDLPFILFTGKGSEEIASDAISAGVTDYLQKSTGAEQYTLLANRVRNAVRSYRSQHALAERNQRLETLIGNLPGIVYRCYNESGWPMEFVGGECEELTGYPASALETGAATWGEDILHPDDRERMWDAVQDALAADDPFEVTYRILTRDGDVRWMWERGRGVDTLDDGAVLEGFITDITDQKERERALERLHDTTRDVMQADTEGEVAETVVESVQALLDVPFIGCWLYDPDTNALEPVAVRDASGALRDDLPTYHEGTGLSWNAFEAGEVTVYGDVSTQDGRYNPDTPVRSEIIVPLGRYGVLNIGSTGPDAFTETDVSLARLIAANTEAALERASRA